MINKLKISLLVLALVLFAGFSFVNAADITYSVDTVVDLSDPDINLTILSGSVATSVTVNAGSVVVTVPESGIFKITSADRYFNFSGETQFGVITKNCASPSLETLTITAPAGIAQTITITPGSSSCSLSGGGGAVTPPAATSATPATPATPAVPTISPAIPATPATPATPAAKVYNFGTKTLKNGSKGEAVMELQRFLNQVLNLGLKIDGKLGPKTIAVIKKWQKANGLVADGLIGSKTKAKMNASIK